MLNLKKLIFAPIFLISFAYLCYLTNTFLTSGESLFSFSWDALLIPLILSAVVILTGFFFVLFATLAQDWKLVGGTILIAAIIPVVFLPSPLNLYLAIGTIISLAFIFALLLNKLKNYLNFQPTVLLYSPIKNLSTLLVLIIALLYFLSMSATISQKGFDLPDSLIDSVLKLTDPATLESAGSSPNLIKATIKSQTQDMIKPFEGFIAPTLAILIFFTLTSFISLLSIFTTLLLWITFYILKSTGYVKFVTEMREVKKLVV